MIVKKRLLLLITAAFVLIVGVSHSTALAKDEVNKNWRGLAISGYDPVAYHSEGRAVAGSSKHEVVWKDAKWRFASESNRDRFKANPERYAPRYGGYCAWAVSQGYTADVDPENAWSLVEGKLYLNYNVAIKKKWEADIPGLIQKANANWPGVLK